MKAVANDKLKVSAHSDSTASLRSSHVVGWALVSLAGLHQVEDGDAARREEGTADEAAESAPATGHRTEEA